MKVKIGEERLIYSVPINEATKKWGVYAIPRMWRDISGKIIVRLNGEADIGDTDNMLAAPNLYFISEDNGKTWSKSYAIIGETLEETRKKGDFRLRKQICRHPELQ